MPYSVDMKARDPVLRCRDVTCAETQQFFKPRLTKATRTAEENRLGGIARVSDVTVTSKRSGCFSSLRSSHQDPDIGSEILRMDIR